MLNKRSWNFTVLIALINFAVLAFINISYKKPVSIQNNTGCKGCNLVIIDIDVLRYDAIDCKNKYELTPNICKFIGQSVNLENNASQSDFTKTSMASMMTSLYPSSHMNYSPLDELRVPKEAQMPNIIRGNGYASLLAEDVDNDGYTSIGAGDWYDWFDGKTSLGLLTDSLKSYEKIKKPYFVYIFSWKLHAPYLSVRDEVEKNSNGTKTIPNLPLDQAEFDVALGNYLTANFKKVFTQKAIAENADIFSGELNNKGPKLFELFKEYDNDENKRLNYLKNSWQAKYNTYFGNVDGNDPSQVSYIRSLYQETLKNIDAELKDTFEYLSQPSIADHTIVMLHSDHGEEFYDHKLFGHQNNLYQELVHTPLAIKVPGIGPAVITGLTQDVDIMPTLLNALKMRVPSTVQGENLLPVLFAPETKTKNYQIAQKGDAYYLESYRKGDLKVIVKNGEPIELYNLSTDPAETKNLIVENLPTAKALYNEYRAIIKPLPRYDSKKDLPSVWLDEQKRQKLKDQGYF